jgi:hypothetical protein
MEPSRGSRHLLARSLLALPALAQTTWHVDVHGSPPGSGTPADPYTSIQNAIVQASTVDGDTLLVHPGTYDELVNTLGKHLTLRSSAGPLATVITTSAPGTVVRLQATTPGSVLEGFSVTSSVAGSTGVRANSGTIRRCLVYGTDAGIRSDFDAWIEECTITGNGVGVRVQLFAGCAFLKNSIVWGNALDLEDATCCTTIDHCTIASLEDCSGPGGLGGLDPWFWNAAELDFHLRPGSNAIDAGNPSDPHDPDGSVIDVGALTYDPTYAPPPTVYCTAKTNSLGCVPSIAGVGTASASGSPFTITCVQELSHKLGLLFYGYAPKAAAYQGGWLCVQSPVHRTGVMDSGGTIGVDDCSGVYAFDFDALIQGGTDPSLAAGEIVYAQFWSRDPSASFTTVRSDGLRFGIAP